MSSAFCVTVVGGAGGGEGRTDGRTSGAGMNRDAADGLCVCVCLPADVQKTKLTLCFQTQPTVPGSGPCGACRPAESTSGGGGVKPSTCIDGTNRVQPGCFYKTLLSFALSSPFFLSFFVSFLLRGSMCD